MAKKLNLAHFASRANEAAFWEAWVGAVLSRCGLYTVHHPFTLAKHPGEVASYAHTWDLDVSRYDPREWEFHPDSVHETEVKSLNLNFTKPEEYPNGDVLVCSAASHKRKNGKACFRTRRRFLMVSRATGSILYVPLGTMLSEKEVTDMERGETYGTMYCKKEDLRGLADYVKAVSV